MGVLGCVLDSVCCIKNVHTLLH